MNFVHFFFTLFNVATKRFKGKYTACFSTDSTALRWSLDESQGVSPVR